VTRRLSSGSTLTATPIQPEELLWAWLREGWAYRQRQGWDPRRNGVEKYKAQIELEMRLIIEKEFTSYFLMVSDILRWAKDRGIAVGPGRGSSAASIVCWLLRITEPDPLDFPLTDFSRFIDPTREDLPDIDVDFQSSRRHEVRQYVETRYGKAYVGNIGTFTKYKGKNALKDVVTVFRVDRPAGPDGERAKQDPAFRSDIERLKGMIVERSGGDSRADAALGDTIQMFEGAQEIKAKYPREIGIAEELEGNYRSMSTHSAGVVVATHPIAEITAQYTRVVKGREITAVAVDKYDAEYLELMKMDLLGLSTMEMLAKALAFAGMTLEDLYRLPLDDPETIDAFHRNDVIGVFQFEGRATRLVGRDLKPDDFLELVDVNALSRPGPLFSGTTAEYIDVKHERREATKIHPVIDRIAAGTKGQIIYQEQILHALSEFGGLPVRKVHDIRRIISKKLGEAAFNSSFEAFAEGAKSLHGASRELANEVWSRVVTSASYAFVYSHSLSYTMIGYWAMWMKVNHPTAFYAAQLSEIKEEKWPKLIRDAEAHGVQIDGVSLNRSGRGWTPVPGEKLVVAGFEQLKGVGPALATKILAYREAKGDLGFESFEELEKVNGIGPAMMVKLRPLITGDDPFGLMRVQLALDSVRMAIAEREIPLPVPNADSDKILDVPADRTVCYVGMVKLKEYKDVLEDERSRTGDDMDVIRARIKRPELATSCVLHSYDDGGEDVYVRITRYDFPKYRTALENLREDTDVVWVEARKSKGGFGASIYVKRLVVIDPEDDDDESEDEPA
jgi:DNA polymerase III subunit alpha